MYGQARPGKSHPGGLGRARPASESACRLGGAAGSVTCQTHNLLALAAAGSLLESVMVWPSPGGHGVWGRRVTGPGRVINTSYYYSLQTPYIQTPIGLHCCSTQTHAKKLGTVRFTTIRKVPRTHEPMARGLVRANPLLQQGRGHNTPCYLLIQTLCTKFRVTANYFLLRLITT